MKRLREQTAVRIIAGIVLLLVIFSAIVSTIGYNSFTDALMDQFTEGAFMTAATAARFVDADRMEAYAQSGGVTEEYQKVWQELDWVCDSTGSTFVYVIQPDRTDYGHITFLFSVINHSSPYAVYDFGYVRATTNDDYREKYRALYEQKADRELVIRDKGYIQTDPHITAMVALKGSDGEVKAILCVQRQLNTLVQERNTYLKKVALVLIVLAVLVIVGQSAFLHRTLLSPLALISEEAARFSAENGKRGKRLQDTIRNRDEIGQLAASIDQMEEQIQQYVEDLTKITAEKERIQTELSLAKQIQASMLPSEFPPFPDRREFDLYATMDPARQVGGDFYDFFLIDSDHLGLVMADVSGKGIPAALFMMISKVILQSCAMLGVSAAEILTKTNEALCSKNQMEMFVTVWLGILEISTGKLRAANAGHEYPMIKRPHTGFELYKDKHGFVIGGLDGMKYTEYELQLEPGTKLFLYTDGIPEATDAKNCMFGTEGTLAALNAAPDESPEQLLKNVQDAVTDFVNGAEQFDDMTMLCLEYRGKDGQNGMPERNANHDSTEDTV